MSTVSGNVEQLLTARTPGRRRGNTMAPCVVIGERAADLLEAQHTL